MVGFEVDLQRMCIFFLPDWLPKEPKLRIYLPITRAEIDGFPKKIIAIIKRE